MTDTPTPPSKREVMLALLEHAEAQVHVDARREGVDLPDRLRASSNVRLDYGYGLTPPIPDLTIDEDGIRATLSFNRVPHATFIPWSAVFLIADFAGRGAVWRDDLPPELVAQADPEPVPEQNAVLVTQPDLAPVARRFGVLDGDVGRPEQAPPRSDSANDDGTPPDEPEPPRPRPALRLVK